MHYKHQTESYIQILHGHQVVLYFTKNCPCALIKHHTMKIKRGCRGTIPCPGHFTPRERAPDTHWIGGKVDPRAGNSGKQKNHCPC
jgi:hypothetical protein